MESLLGMVFLVLRKETPGALRALSVQEAATFLLNLGNISICDT